MNSTQKQVERQGRRAKVGCPEAERMRRAWGRSGLSWVGTTDGLEDSKQGPPCSKLQFLPKW